MMTIEELHVGYCYFNMYFIDEQLSWPVIKSGVFLGFSLTDRRQDAGESLLFQETDSLAEHGLYFHSDQQKQCRLFSVHVTALDTLFDAKGLRTELSSHELNINNRRIV